MQGFRTYTTSLAPGTQRLLSLTGLGLLVTTAAALGAALGRHTALRDQSRPVQVSAADETILAPVVRLPKPLEPGKTPPRLVAHRRFCRQFHQDGIPTEVPEVNVTDSAFIVRIALGEPAQPFLVSLDLSSNDLWVRAAHCHHCATLAHFNDLRRFDRFQSQTFRDGGAAAWNAGPSRLRLAFDTFRLGNATMPDVAFWQTLEPEESAEWHSPLDGVLGLAPPRKPESPLNVLLQTYRDSMKQPTFTLRMPEDGQAGALIFGHTPDAVNWVEVASHGTWAVELGQVAFSHLRMSGRAALVDPSSNCLVLPAADARLFFEQAQQSLAQDSRCSSLPRLSFVIGGQAYQLSGTDYGISRLGGCDLCVLADPDAAMWTLGEVFSRKFPVVYDFGSSPARIGFPVVSQASVAWRLAKTLALCALCMALLGVMGLAARRSSGVASGMVIRERLLRSRGAERLRQALVVPDSGLASHHDVTLLTPRSVSTDEMAA